MSRRKQMIFWPLFVAVLFTIMMVITGGNGVDLDFGDDSLTIIGPEKYAFTIAYDNIAELALVTLGDPGSPTSEGQENRNFRWGEWANNDWQTYTICASKNMTQYILITTSDGKHITFNYQNSETTAEVYRMFTELLASKNY